MRALTEVDTRNVVPRLMPACRSNAVFGNKNAPSAGGCRTRLSLGLALTGGIVAVPLAFPGNFSAGLKLKASGGSQSGAF
jgi:hypothetical protein